MKRLIVLLAMGALCLGGSATASPPGRHRLDNRLMTDEQIAYGYWGARPACPGGVVFSAAGLPADVGAYALRPCGVEVSSAALRRPRDQWYTVNGHRMNVADREDTTLCVIVVHEVGHLLGHQHSDDPSDVMFGGSPDGRWLDSVPACGPPRMANARYPTRSP